MAQLVASRSFTLTPGAPMESPWVTSSVDAHLAHVWLRRPTTANPLNWTAATKIEVKIAVEGAEPVIGTVTGGVRSDGRGGEVQSYGLGYGLPIGLGDAGREYMKTALKDAEGFYNGVPVDRLLSGRRVRVEVRILSGPAADLEITVGEIIDAPAPTIRTKNSVSWDAKSSAFEHAGDGTLTCPHVPVGSANYFGHVGIAFSTPAHSSCSWGATSMGVPKYDASGTIQSAFGLRQAVYTKTAVPTGSQTVTSITVNGGPNTHIMICNSFLGAEQNEGSSVGTVAQAEGSTSVSVDVPGTPGTDSMIVDFLCASLSGTPVAGANQTLNATQNDGTDKTASSTQSGADGATMSYTISGADYGNLVAIEVMAAVAVATPPPWKYPLKSVPPTQRAT